MSAGRTATAVLGSRWLRLGVAAVVLLVLVRKLGAGPFLDGIRLVDGWSLVLAFVIGAVTTACCAWRWHLVSQGLDVPVPFRGALSAYYRPELGEPFTTAGCCLYRDGRDSVAWHGDTIGRGSRELDADTAQLGAEQRGLGGEVVVHVGVEIEVVLGEVREQRHVVDDAVDPVLGQRVALTNRLTRLLKQYFPQALAWVGDVASSRRS